MNSAPNPYAAPVEQASHRRPSTLGLLSQIIAGAMGIFLCGIAGLFLGVVGAWLTTLRLPNNGQPYLDLLSWRMEWGMMLGFVSGISLAVLRIGYSVYKKSHQPPPPDPL